MVEWGEEARDFSSPCRSTTGHQSAGEIEEDVPCTLVGRIGLIAHICSIITLELAFDGLCEADLSNRSPMSNRFHRQDSNASVIPASAGAPADAAAGAVMLEDIHRMNSRASRISKSSRTDGGGLAGPAGQQRKLSVYDETDVSSIKGDETEAAGRESSGGVAEEEDHHVFGMSFPKCHTEESDLT